jgi:hypothetical protein
MGVPVTVVRDTAYAKGRSSRTPSVVRPGSRGNRYFMRPRPEFKNGKPTSKAGSGRRVDAAVAPVPCDALLNHRSGYRPRNEYYAGGAEDL